MMELVYSQKIYKFGISWRCGIIFVRVSICEKPKLTAQNNNRSTNEIYLAAIAEDEKANAIRFDECYTESAYTITAT